MSKLKAGVIATIVTIAAGLFFYGAILFLDRISFRTIVLWFIGALVVGVLGSIAWSIWYATYEAFRK